jgi:hypothetical protein
MTRKTRAIAAVAAGALSTLAALAGPAEARTGPEFRNGQAQIVAEFEDPDGWIRHDLWVETSFDSDGDGRRDRMHVDVTRPGQTDTEGLTGLSWSSQQLSARENLSSEGDGLVGLALRGARCWSGAAVVAQARP